MRPRSPSPAIQAAAAACLLILVLAAVEARAPGTVPGRVEVDGRCPDAPTRVGTHRMGALSMMAGPPAPRRPEKWQKIAPCDPDTEETIHGACYVRTARQPPCPGSFFEERGACFVAVAQAPRPRTSIEE